MAFLRSLLASTLALSSIVYASPTGQGLERRTGSVPSLQGSPVLIDPQGVYIRVNRMNDGSLIAGYTDYSNNQAIATTARSTNNGGTWSHLGEVFRGDTATHDIDNAFPMQLSNNRVLFAYRNHDKNQAGYTYFRISISSSDDGGVTFKYLSTVDERTAQGVNGLWEPFMRIANDGSIQCYYSSENANNDQDGLMRVSKDGGQTWGDRIPVSGQGLTSRDGMIGVAPIDNNGNLIAVFENTEDGPFSVRAVTSSNDGLSWGNRHLVYRANGASNLAGAPQVYNVWGTLVTSFMTNETHDAGRGTGYDNGDMKIITSTDGAKTWGPSFITGPAPARWPGVFNLDPTHVLALYSRDGTGALGQVVKLS